MAQRRSGQRDIATRTGARRGRGRGFVTMTLPLPRFVVAKILADGRAAFYFYVPGWYRKLGCTVANQPLGRDYAVACGEDGNGGRAAALNGQFDEWQDMRRGIADHGRTRADLWNNPMALSGIATQQSLHREGFTALAPRLRTHDADDREHRYEKRRQAR